MNLRDTLAPLIFAFFLANCGLGQDIRDEGIENFDISPDGRQIVFSFLSNGMTSLHTVSADGGDGKAILKSDEFSYTNPRYAPDGRSILFIGYDPKKVTNSSIFSSKADGGMVKQLTKGNEIITEAIFSGRGDSLIYYCKANEYQKHSPLGITNAHNFDIYSINTKNNQVTKLSNLDAYGVSSISEVQNDFMLFHIGAGEESGIYTFEIGNPIRLKKISPTNKPRRDEQYGHPAFDSFHNVLIFTAPYQLYKMNLTENIATLIFDSGDSNIQIIRLLESRQKILFKKEVGKNMLELIDYTGGNLKKIRINVRK